ncbi:MAG: AAA family ATPase, partial [Chloroflexota bacterium]|nr:AAA family ATPase [Chloroflexota bacterium]
TESASNLAPILDRILSNKNSRKTLLSLVKYLLPFINDIGVQNQTDESSSLYVKEAFTDETRLYADMISEGTIAAIALVVALYFEENPLLIFEDPDRGMHPKLMSRMVEMMKEVSKDKQIIVTTHHPEMVRYAGVENLLLVSRDEDGFSQISRPADKTMVKRFLENDIGIDELYVDDLLEV